jgi:hypothetical protein
VRDSLGRCQRSHGLLLSVDCDALDAAEARELDGGTAGAGAPPSFIGECTTPAVPPRAAVEGESTTGWLPR